MLRPRPPLTASPALLAAILGCSGGAPAEPLEACARPAAQCRLPAGPLGVCEVVHPDRVGPDRLACMPQH